MIRRVSITRKYTAERTYGILCIDDEAVCVTLELPWMGNLRKISCIPEGKYKCVLCNSYKFGKTYKVVNVPERDEILFHRGNRTKDSKGCILLGQCFGELDGESAVLNSKPAFEYFLKIMTGMVQFELVIDSPTGKPTMNIANFYRI